MKSRFTYVIALAAVLALLFSGCTGQTAGPPPGNNAPVAAPATTILPSPAEFRVNSINPQAMGFKTRIQATCDVVIENIGGTAGTFEAIFKVDAANVETKSVALASGESKTVTFAFIPAQEGPHTLGVGDKTVGINVAPSKKVVKIVYVAWPIESYDEYLYIINLDGTGKVKLTPDTGVRENFASFSPDGKKIVFGRIDSTGRYIMTMNADGTERVKLTSSLRDYMPSWSPDGASVCFASLRDGNAEIYVMAADGSNQRRLTFDAAVDWLPIWSPDSTKIAFLSDRGGVERWWVMNADGTDQKLIADVVVSEPDSEVPTILYRACWTEDYFFAPQLTSEKLRVLTLDVEKGGEAILTLVDSLSVVAPPRDEMIWIASWYSRSTASIDIGWVFSGLTVVQSPDVEIPCSCVVVYE